MYSIDFLINHVENAINKAYNNISKINNDILSIDGMSGDKTRHLYNNICNLENSHYLEIGTWKGSSFISAIYNNNINGTVIDNWSQFDGPKEEFNNNINKYLQNKNIKIIDKDCWTVTNDDIILLIDIYLYDGGHSLQDQIKAITYYTKYCSKYFILLVDDWVSNNETKSGTFEGIEESNLKIHYFNEIGLVNTDMYHTGGNTFWNGCGIFVCERTDI